MIQLPSTWSAASRNLRPCVYGGASAFLFADEQDPTVLSMGSSIAEPSAGQHVQTDDASEISAHLASRGSRASWLLQLPVATLFGGHGHDSPNLANELTNLASDPTQLASAAMWSKLMMAIAVQCNFIALTLTFCGAMYHAYGYQQLKSAQAQERRLGGGGGHH